MLALKTFLENQLARVSKKSPIANAIQYVLNHWQGLIRFLNDGRIDLDSDIVEWSMRPQVQIPVHRGQSFRRIADSIPVIADSF